MITVQRKTNTLALIAAPILTFAILFAIYRIYHFAPFGHNSLAAMDADIQYLDFFACLKDVLEGRQQITYTLTKGLGGTNLGNFSYYLTSPFNLLVLLFRKEQFHIMFDLIVALKLATAGLTMAFFLSRRFTLKSVICILLSLGYSLSQYSIAQSSNIMWLDGVYMLPLILLGVHDAFVQNKCTLLSTSVALSIVFNWYSAGINCVFSCFYFLIEYFLTNETYRWKSFLPRFCTYACAMLIGVLLSCFIFFPAIASLMGGAGNRVSLRINFRLNGNPLSMLHSYALGATSTSSNVALFCGSIALIGCLGLIKNKLLTQRRNIFFRVLFTFLMLFFYWQPFYVLFSLLVEATSYSFRYSYVGTFTLIFVAAFVYQSDKNAFSDGRMLSNCVLYAVVLLFLDFAHPTSDSKYLYLSIVYLFSQLGCLYLITNAHNNCLKATFTTFLVLIAMIELGDNARLLMRRYHNSNVTAYEKYSLSAQKQISHLQTQDGGAYRISQNTPRGSAPNSVTANYNESVAYNYPSISSYSSCPDSRQNDFLSRLGYRTEATLVTVVNTPLLAADALLGVKYYLSAYPINGLEKVPFNLEANKKSIYLNKFALPLFFTYESGHADFLSQAPRNNPFVYQNMVFSQLLGRQTELYSPVTFTKKVQGRRVDYTLVLPDGDMTFYGNIPWYRKMEAEIKVNSQLITPYSLWLSPSVFLIPAKKGERTVTVSLIAREQLAIKDEQFYALDLKKLEQASKAISQNAVQDVFFKGTTFRCAINGRSDQKLYLSIPYHKGWHVQRNGKTVIPELFGDCMMTIPLLDGENTIEMKYVLPLQSAGILLSCLGVCGLFGMRYYLKK